jgi:hypothetical protein
MRAGSRTAMEPIQRCASLALNLGGCMVEPSYPVRVHDYQNDAEELEHLEAALDEAPRGALVVSAIAVGLLMVGWLGMYFLVFLPRGPVG